jgi:glucuronate isomerase
LFERFNIEVLSTTNSPQDSSKPHRVIRESGRTGRVVPAFRPDPVIDSEFDGFVDRITQLGNQTGEDTFTWKGYLAALRKRRVDFKSLGCTSTDHGNLTEQTADLSCSEAEALFASLISGQSTPVEQELFRAQMLTELAQMSLEDGLIMQIHPGATRYHNRFVYQRFGRDCCSVPV